MAGPNSPIGSRRRLGAELRRLRNRKGLTLDDVAEQMTCSTSKISRLETGKGIPKVPDVRELMRIYGVRSESEQEELLRLVHDGREHGWWEPLTDGVQPERFALESLSRYVALESDATTVRSFDLTVVPGLLQTESYMRALLATTLPHHPQEEIDLLVELRLKRQLALVRNDPPPLMMRALIDEAVLCRGVGGEPIMDAQLEHLHAMAERPNISIRVLPFSSGIVRAHAGPFVLLEIPAALGWDVVYIESHAHNQYLDARSDVDQYKAVHADTLGVALTGDSSRQMIREYRVEHRTSDHSPRR
jgi:transcriptional regulator with XRE-family HTH domain